MTVHIDVAGLYSCFTWNDAVPYLWVILERPECPTVLVRPMGLEYQPYQINQL